MLKALGRDIVIYGTGEFVFKFISFAVFPIYAHVLSLADFGTWGLLATTATLVGFIANLGTNQAVQRFYFNAPAGRSEEPRIVSTGLAQLLVSTLVIAGLAIFAVQWLPMRTGGLVLDRLVVTIALLIVLPDQLLQFCLDILRLHFTPFRFLSLAFAKNVVGTAVAVWLVAVQHAGLMGLFTGLLSGSLAAVPLGLWLIRRDLVWRWDPRIGRTLFAFGFPLVFTSLAAWVYTSIDRWMLADMSSPEQLGLYSVAAKYATIVTFLVAAFAQAWIPFAIRLSRDSPDHPMVYGRVLTLWYFALALVALALALFSTEALMLLTPRPYWPAAQILPMLCAGLVLFGTTQVTFLGITLENRTILTTYATWIAAGVNIVLNLILIPIAGGLGSAAATFVSYAVLTCFMLFWTQRLRPIPLNKTALAYCTALALVTAALSFLPTATGLAAILIKAGAIGAALLGAWAAGIFDLRWPITTLSKESTWQES